MGSQNKKPTPAEQDHLDATRELHAAQAEFEHHDSKRAAARVKREEAQRKQNAAAKALRDEAKAAASQEPGASSQKPGEVVPGATAGAVPAAVNTNGSTIDATAADAQISS